MLTHPVASGEIPLDCVVREAHEEASLDPSFVRSNAEYVSTITYLYIREARAGGESGLIQPECQYVYDLEMPASITPTPNDSEVQEFYLWDLEKVQEHLAKGEFKPNCAMLMLDFLIRRGILNDSNESNVEEIKRRLHRDLVFPGPHKVTST
jgi:8-oxo-dGTP pyrophosphatase MutT (NUDIX family)